MTKYILQREGKYKVSHKAFEFCRKVQNYARFLNQPLKLGMFLPCDEHGNILERWIEPKKSDYWSDNDTVFSAELYKHDLDKFKKYQEAKEKVLFKDFKLQRIDREKVIISHPYFDFIYCTDIKTFNVGVKRVEKIEHLPEIIELIDSVIKNKFI